MTTTKSKTKTKQTTNRKQTPTKKTAAKNAPAKTKQKPKGKLSGLDAAVKVLAEAGEPLRCKQIVETMLAKGYWTTGGKTPAATIYAAILREIQTKGKEARFKKTDRGLFAFNR
ncbi:MAG: winged helix-turn-helix domain-containing protein [Planctomycetes bacterium]|nr:winged helix-turn-helix domain-containing protein [Planctomycetota bacterium]